MDWLKFGFIGFVILSVAGGGYRMGQKEVQQKWDKQAKEQAEAVLEVERKHRAQEQAWAKANAVMIDNWLAEQRGVQDDYEATIAELNNGTLVLRQHYRGCQRQLSEDRSTPGTAEGGTGEGLPVRDQEAFIRIGRECNSLRVGYLALEAYAEAAFERCGGASSTAK